MIKGIGLTDSADLKRIKDALLELSNQSNNSMTRDYPNEFLETFSRTIKNQVDYNNHGSDLFPSDNEVISTYESDIDDGVPSSAHNDSLLSLPESFDDLIISVIELRDIMNVLN